MFLKLRSRLYNTKGGCGKTSRHCLESVRIEYKSSVVEIQSNPDNSNLQGKEKKVRVIGSSSYGG